MADTDSLLIADLLENYRSGGLTPRHVMERLLGNGVDADPHHVWITRLTHDQVMAFVQALDGREPGDLPLYGIPFVIKDNIDLAGVPTSAACPEFTYTPQRSAHVVQKLLDAGAIPLGKTNLDQFATGLVGTRSPFGACRNSFNLDYISGGSSAGSAVAVALGMASFALGTDTAGSGRVPAAFNNIIGLKPSIGRSSSTGIVPACRSLDCVSIFALTAEDAARVLDVAEGFDAEDAYSRKLAPVEFAGLRLGIPRTDQREFFGDTGYAALFERAVNTAAALGCTVVEVDFAPFLATARLLYEGPWLAERYAAVGNFLDAHPRAVNPVTLQIIEAGKHFTASQAFRGHYELKSLKRESEHAWTTMDVLMTPTAGTIPTLRDVAADPIGQNAKLGYYTNFMNLLDLSGVAVPAGFRADGLPFGVTLAAVAGAERALLRLAGRLHRASVETLGALALRLPTLPPLSAEAPELPNGYLAVAVCGAHMQGLPLNRELTSRGGFLLESTRTSARYRLLALPGGPPHRPGLVRVNDRDGGAAIELEVWALPMETAGSFLAGIGAPLGLGKVELDSGAEVTGFICEGYATGKATDITHHGGWRAYIEAAAQQPV